MSAAPGPTTEVLRGMGVERVPVRLSRARAQPRAAEDAARPADGESLREHYEEAARLGYEEGLRAGHEEGLRQGLAAAETEVGEARLRACAEASAPLRAQEDRLRALLEELAQVHARRVSAAEDDMVALCFEAVCRLLGAHALQAEVVRAQVSSLLAAHEGRQLSVRLHPRDVAFLEGFLPVHAPGRSAIALAADPAVTFGGCIVEGDKGALDARLDTMLQSCKEVLLAARDQRRAEPVADSPGAT